MNFSKKRKPYYASNKSKRSKQFSLKPGLKGFICTCNCREKECIRESYNILNEYADILFGEENQKKTEGEVKSVQEKEDSSDEDVDTALNKELDTLKAEKNKEPRMRRFQVVESGANNCIFIQTDVDEPVKLVHHIMKDVKESKKQKTRFLLRLLPVEVTCKAYVEDIRMAADGLFDKYFTKEGKTFAVLFNRRNNSSITRDEVIQPLAEMVLRRHPDNKADLKHPQLVILVEVIRGNCCISVIPEYFEFRKYNLLELCSSENVTTEANNDEINSTKNEAPNNEINSNKNEEADKMNSTKNEEANIEINSNKNEEAKNVNLATEDKECTPDAPAKETESTEGNEKT